MYETITKDVQIYFVAITSQIYDDSNTYLPNTNIREFRGKYKRPGCLKVSDEHSTEQELPAHIILWVVDYQRVKTTETSMLGSNTGKDLVAKLTMLE